MRLLLCALLGADAKLTLMDGRSGGHKRCEPQYIPVAGGGGGGLSAAEVKLLVREEVAALRDDLVGRMQTAASMATQPLEAALVATQAECRTLERLDGAVDALKNAPGIEEVDQRLAFSDAKLAAAISRLDAATLAAGQREATQVDAAPSGDNSVDAQRLARLEQAVADMSRDVAGATAAARTAASAANAAPAPRAPAGSPPPPPVASGDVAAALARAAELERAVVDVAEALEREARARMDADTAVDARFVKLENATVGVAERHAKALETLITYTYPFQQRGVSMS